LVGKITNRSPATAIGSVVIDAKFGREGHGSISRNCDWLSSDWC
jgi:hypothetical protein